MGDIAERIEDGTICECCHDFIGPPVGYPRECKECRQAAGEEIEEDEDEVDAEF